MAGLGNAPRLLLAGLGGAALLAAALLLATHGSTPPPVPLAVSTVGPVHTVAPPRPTPHPLTVDVSGAVATPGVYTLRPGSRAIDALAAAGGARPDADLDRVNLAAPLNDGEQVAVPVQGAAPATPTRPAGRATGHGPTPTPEGPWLLNINTATADDFRALPGIGQVTANRLVAYRTQNGPYGSVDDLLKAGLHQSELTRLRARLSVQ